MFVFVCTATPIQTRTSFIKTHEKEREKRRPDRKRVTFFSALLHYYTTPVLIRRKLDKQIDREEKSGKKSDRKKTSKGTLCNLMSCVRDAPCRKTVELAKGTPSTKITKKK